VLFDHYLDLVRQSEHTLRRLESHYRKEAVCEPGCTHSRSEPLCSQQGQQLFGPITGSDEGEGA